MAAATVQAAQVAAAAQRIRHLTLGLRAARSLWSRRVPTDPWSGSRPWPRSWGGCRSTREAAPSMRSRAARRTWLRRCSAARPGGCCVDGVPWPAPRLLARRRWPHWSWRRTLAPHRSASRRTRTGSSRSCPTTGKAEGLAGALRQRADQILTEFYDNADQAGPLAHTLIEDPQPSSTDLLVAVRGQRPESQLLAAARPARLRRLGRCRGRPDGRPAGGRRPRAGQHRRAARARAGRTGRVPGARHPAVEVPLRQLPGLAAARVGRHPRRPGPRGADQPARSSTPYWSGANVQTLGELRWRNIPITTRWTPLRRFWQRVNVAAGEAATDIRPIVSLSHGPRRCGRTRPPLGDLSHLADPSHGANLVVVLHTELFRRYPATSVYLVPNPGGPSRMGRRPRRGPGPGQPSPTAGATGLPDLQRHADAGPGVLRVRGSAVRRL